MSGMTVNYRLPVSALRFAGTVAETTDAVLGQATAARTGTVALDVMAEVSKQTLTLDENMLKDTAASFTLTDDGRLVDTDVKYTGQVGAVVLGVVGAAANIAGLFAGGIAPALAAVEGDGGGEDLTDDQKVAAAYAAAFPEIATVRGQYESLVEDAVEDIASLSLRLLRATDWVERATILNHLRVIEQQLPAWRAELDRLNAHYSAWRSGTLVTHTATHEAVLTLDTLRAADVVIGAGGYVDFGGQPAGVEARALWDLLGLTVTMPPKDDDDVPRPTEENVLVVREPRFTTLSVYERGEDGAARLQRTFEQLVMDSACEHYEIKLRSSWFAERQTKLSFSALGALTGIVENAPSGAAAMAGTLGSLPETVAGGLESAQKMRTAWAGLRDAGLTEELARTKLEADLKQQELTLAGLKATDSQYAELERLKQQAEIVAKRKAIGDSVLDSGDRENAMLKQQVDLLKNQKDLSESTRALQAEHELSSLRLEIERLKARSDLADAEKPKPKPKPDDPNGDPSK